MGRITRFIGGQTVADPSGSGERNFIVDLDASETRVAGNIYFTATEITNSVELTDFNRVDVDNIPYAGGNVTFVVSGDEGAAFTITNSNGANVDGVVGATGVSANVVLTVNSDADGGTVVFGVVIRASDPETVFADDFDVADRTISITQDAQPTLMSQLSGYSLSGLPDTFSDPPGQTGGNQTGHSGTISFTNNSGQTITMTGSSSGPTESVDVPATQTFGSGAHTIHLSYGLSWGNIEGQGRVGFSISVSFSAPGFAGFGQTLLSGTAGQPGS